MEINFIEEVDKALVTLGVERLVRTLPMGSVWCIACGDKVVYTWFQAHYKVTKKIRETPKVYLDIYVCKEFGGNNYHLTNLDKKLSDRNYWLRKEIKEKKAALDEYRIQADDRIRNHKIGYRRQNLVVVYGRHGIITHYSKDLRRKILQALVFPLQGLRKPRTHRLRRRWQPAKRTPRRDTARRDLPRGETMTKMLAWPNGRKIWGIPEDIPRSGKAVLRRRNRSREAEAVRREVSREIELTCPEIGCHPRFHDRVWDMNDEYTAPSNEVWRALVENDEGLRFIDFDGRYAVGEDGG